VTVADNDAVGLVVAHDSLRTCDAAGCGGSYTISLGSRPTAPVTISVTAALRPGGLVPADQAAALTVSPSQYTFTPEAWREPAAFSVAVVAAAPVCQGNRSEEVTYELTHGVVRSDDAAYADRSTLPPAVVRVALAADAADASWAVGGAGGKLDHGGGAHGRLLQVTGLNVRTSTGFLPYTEQDSGVVLVDPFITVRLSLLGGRWDGSTVLAVVSADAQSNSAERRAVSDGIRLPSLTSWPVFSTARASDSSQRLPAHGHTDLACDGADRGHGRGVAGRGEGRG
jgi:hypothetical protein